MTDSEKTVRALFCAFNKLTASRGTLDAWNFFPTADFDTGSNLCRTMKAGVEAIKRDESLSVCELLSRTAKSMLRFSRGNSGAILAAMCKGFSDEVALRGSLQSDCLPTAFGRALEHARILLPTPVVERTMLGLVEHCQAACVACKEDPLPQAWKFIATTARQYLNAGNPPPDPGALGLQLIFEGISDFLNDTHSAPIAENGIVFRKSSADAAYTYAVALSILSKADVPPDALVRRLKEYGEDVRITQHNDIFSITLKTNQPDHVLSTAMRFGSLTDIAIDNLFYSRA